MDLKKVSLREKCPYSEFFWSIFSHIWIEYGKIRSISPYSVQMREKTDQKNSECGYFSRRIMWLWTNFQLQIALYVFLIFLTALNILLIWPSLSKNNKKFKVLFIKFIKIIVVQKISTMDDKLLYFNLICFKKDKQMMNTERIADLFWWRLCDY